MTLLVDSDDDLFAELDVPSIVVEKPLSNDNKKADEAWAHWSKMTERPQQRNPERDFIKAYKKLLADGHSHGRMLTVIAGAARMPVRPRDPKDLRRVLFALQSEKGTKEALALLSERGRDRVPFPDPTQPVSKSTVAELEAACRVASVDWTASDHEAAGVLTHRYTAEELETLAEHTARNIASDGVLPTDMLRNAGSLTGASGAASGVYEAGRAEDDKFDGIDFAADVLAEQMRRAGKSAADIRKVHALAPEGYWDAVLDVLIEKPMNACADIYDDLQKKFQWHPSSRTETKG